VDQGTKKVVFTPDAGYVGSAGFSYKATDSHGVDSDPASAAITVNAAPGSGDPGGGSPGGGDPGGGDPGAGGPAPDTTPPTLSIAPLAKQKLAKVLKKGLGVTIGCSETCVASVKLTVAKKLAKKLGIASADVTLGSAKKTLGAGKRKLYVKLGAKARKRLKKARSVRLKLVLRATDAAGNAATRARTLTLKR
jgi:hypothetical protein